MRRLRYMLFTLAILLICLAALAWAILHQDKFGTVPEGERLKLIQASINYKDGQFHNTVPTPTLAQGQSSIKIMAGGLFSKPERLRPETDLPVERHDLKALPLDTDTLIWLGHSSYYLHLAGKRILVDPVFSEYGAPFSFANKIFAGTDLYTAQDMPEIDILLITHDHWDHLDYPTITALMPKVKQAVMPLGVGAHFEHWKYPAEKIEEADWNESVHFQNGLTVHVVPARHYSGRSFTPNKTMWAGFVLETPHRRIYLSGDTGYGPHVGEIAKKFGHFDLAAIDGGQYDPRWPLIHMTPEEAVATAKELNANAMMLAHVGRFAIASHAWDAPFIRAVAAAEKASIEMLTPKIGQALVFDNPKQNFTRWWEGVQ